MKCTFCLFLHSQRSEKKRGVPTCQDPWFSSRFLELYRASHGKTPPTASVMYIWYTGQKIVKKSLYSLQSGDNCPFWQQLIMFDLLVSCGSEADLPKNALVEVPLFTVSLSIFLSVIELQNATATSNVHSCPAGTRFPSGSCEYY